MDVDLEELAAIIEQLDKTEFTDFSFERGDLRIRVMRGGHLGTDPATSPSVSTTATPRPSGTTPVAPAEAPATSATPAPPPAAAPATASPGAAAAGQPADLTVVRAPMLGHFYRAPKPGEQPFVQVGDVVEADSLLCIIEVMKLMNSVPSGSAGEVVEILVEDGALVEFDQPIFAIRQPA